MSLPNRWKLLPFHLKEEIFRCLDLQTMEKLDRVSRLWKALRYRAITFNNGSLFMILDITSDRVRKVNVLRNFTSYPQDILRPQRAGHLLDWQDDLTDHLVYSNMVIKYKYLRSTFGVRPRNTIQLFDCYISWPTVHLDFENTELGQEIFSGLS